MKPLCILAFLLSYNCFTCFSQQPSVVWSKCYGSYYGEYIRTIRVTSDGGFVLAGWTEGDGGDVMGYHGNPSVGDLWIVKLSQGGVIEWQKCVGGIGYEVYPDIQQTPDGGYIVIGAIGTKDCDMPDTHGTTDVWAVKLDAKGEVQWKKAYGGTATEYAFSVDLANDGGYFIAGLSESSDGDVHVNHGDRDMWIIKIDANGKLVWEKSLGGAGTEEANSVRATADGGCIVAGWTESINGDVISNHGKRDAWIVKLSSAGAVEWQKTYGGSSFEEASCLQLTADGGYIVAGYATSADGDVSGNHNSLGPFSDVWIIKLNSTGSLQWQKCYGGKFNERADYIQLAADGGYIATGYAESSDGDLTCNAGNTDAWIIKINSSGSLQWQKSAGGNGSDRGNCIQPLSDGNYIVAANVCSSNIPGWHPPVSSQTTCTDYWILKIAPPSVQVQPSVSIIPASGNVCSGIAATLTAVAMNAGLTPSYKWVRNGVTVGTNSATYTASDFANNEVISCEITSGDPCNYTIATASASNALKVKMSNTPAVTIAASNNIVCGCSPVNFSSTVTNGAVDPFFVWQINGKTAGMTNGPAFTTNVLTPGDVVNCIYYDKTGCIAGGVATSNKVQMQGGSISKPSISISASADTICAGMTALFSAVAVNAGSNPSFQWKVNGVNSGSNSEQFSSSVLKNGDVISCVVSADPTFKCLLSTTDTSNQLKVTVGNKTDPFVQITVSKNPICAGSSVSFSATERHAGNNPAYEWQINGVAVASSKNFTSPGLSNGDKISCVITVDPSYTCSNSPSAVSNVVEIEVKDRTSPSVAINPSANHVCENTIISFTATVQNAGTAPNYQWVVNHQAVATTSPVYTTHQLSNGDSVYCMVVPDADACVNTAVSSNVITAVIYPAPSVIVLPVDTTIGTGKTVQFQTSVSNTVIHYEWTPASKLEDAKLLNPQTIPLNENTTYTVAVETDKGCKALATAVVKVTNRLFMPNSFTPNGDGLNDVFRIPPATDLELKEFSVFNRWGNCVFTSALAAKGWDGNYRGIPSPPGVYVYMIKGRDRKGDMLMKGTVMLVR
jgi:gliding motility-associated-like protein